MKDAAQMSDKELVLLLWGNKEPVEKHYADEFIRRLTDSLIAPSRKSFLKRLIRIGGKLNKERGLDGSGKPLPPTNGSGAGP